MVRTYLKPRLLLDRCVDFLIQHRIQLPTLYSLTEMIRAGLQGRKEELMAVMKSHLTEHARHLLDDLFTAPGDQSPYRLTLLKKLSQSTKPARIKESLADFGVLAELHGALEDVMSILDLGPSGIRYFAGSVLRSRMFQMHQRAEPDRYIHAAAFVAHQFYRIQDNLSDILLNVMVY